MNDWFMGADPDMHCQSIAIIDAELNLISLAVVKVKAAYTGTDAILHMADLITSLPDSCFSGCQAAAVESQEIAYTAKDGRNPRSLMLLANISGILVGQFSVFCHDIYLPAPQAWKGSVAKLMHQKRVCKRMGWEYTVRKDYVVPKDALTYTDVIGKVNDGDWKHIIDSVGLGLWAQSQYEKQQRIERFKNE